MKKIQGHTKNQVCKNSSRNGFQLSKILPMNNYKKSSKHLLFLSFQKSRKEDMKSNNEPKTTRIPLQTSKHLLFLSFQRSRNKTQNTHPTSQKKGSFFLRGGWRKNSPICSVTSLWKNKETLPFPKEADHFGSISSFLLFLSFKSPYKTSWAHGLY